jgi:hypothetical protein
LTDRSGIRVGKPGGVNLVDTGVRIIERSRYGVSRKVLDRSIRHLA